MPAESFLLKNTNFIDFVPPVASVVFSTPFARRLVARKAGCNLSMSELGGPSDCGVFLLSHGVAQRSDTIATMPLVINVKRHLHSCAREIGPYQQIARVGSQARSPLRLEDRDNPFLAEEWISSIRLRKENSLAVELEDAHDPGA